MATPPFNTASISGSALAGLLHQLFSSRSMFVEGALIGRIEERHVISDSSDTVLIRHVAITTWTCDGAARTPVIDGDDVVGRLRMRKRALHQLSVNDVAYLQDDTLAGPRLLLLVTESDPETGSNAVDHTLFQSHPGRPPTAIALAVSNLVSSSDRFDRLADLTIRFGARDASLGKPEARRSAQRASTADSGVASYCGDEIANVHSVIDQYNERRQKIADIAQRIQQQAERISSLRRDIQQGARPPGNQHDALPQAATEVMACCNDGGAVAMFQQAVLASSASFGAAISGTLAAAPDVDNDKQGGPATAEAQPSTAPPSPAPDTAVKGSPELPPASPPHPSSSLDNFFAP
jgi:hypothetical protein